MTEPRSDQVTLRPAVPKDSRRLWKWRNEEATREASFNTKRITFGDHDRWFRGKLADHHTPILIVRNVHGRELGYVRFNIVGEEAEISVSIDAAWRRKGYGMAAIKTGSDQLLGTRTVKRIVAHVKTANADSMAVFERAGFILRGHKQIKGVEACEMIYEGKAGNRWGGDRIDKDSRLNWVTEKCLRKIFSFVWMLVHTSDWAISSAVSHWLRRCVSTM